MPWQSVPGFMVIAGAFTLTGLGLSFVERVAYGRNRRVQIDEFSFQMDRRDQGIKAKEKELLKIKKQIESNAIRDSHHH
jgi:hypothetical protein